MQEEALEKAEQECLADADIRARRRERAAERRELLDQEFVSKFAGRIRELYPGCPAGREDVIAQHACKKYSGRVGRTGAAKDLSERAVDLAVLAHIRHAETDYDDLLADNYDRYFAREQIRQQVDDVLDKWRAG